MCVTKFNGKLLMIVISRRQSLNNNVQNCFKAPPVTLNMTDLDSDEYDWRRRLSRINMTGGDLAKYDWRRRLRGGGSGH